MIGEPDYDALLASDDFDEALMAFDEQAALQARSSHSTGDGGDGVIATSLKRPKQELGEEAKDSDDDDGYYKDSDTFEVTGFGEGGTSFAMEAWSITKIKLTTRLLQANTLQTNARNSQSRLTPSSGTNSARRASSSLSCLPAWPFTSMA